MFLSNEIHKCCFITHTYELVKVFQKYVIKTICMLTNNKNDDIEHANCIQEIIPAELCS